MKLWSRSHRITMAEVDAAEVIFYAVPYFWRSTAYTEWLAEIDRPLRQMLGSGLSTPCVASSCSYRAPMRLDDVVELELRSGRVGTSSYELGLDVRGADGELTAQVETTNVWVDTTGDAPTSVPVPGWFRELLVEPALG